MERKIEKAIRAYGPIYDVDEFNHNFETSFTEQTYNEQIRSFDLSTKADSIDTANAYAESTKEMYLAQIKEIADRNFLNSVFGT